jgi:hypothetical protein
MAEKVRPMRPGEVAKRKEIDFPDAVFEAFNEMITRKFSSGSATFKLDDVVALMAKKGLNRNDIFENHWLDVEDVYRAAGWKVEYDSPAYCETYPATFTFSTRRK